MAELEMNEVQLNEHKVEHYYNIKAFMKKIHQLTKKNTRRIPNGFRKYQQHSVTR